MELFYHPLSRYSQKVLIALYEKQANFFPRITDLHDPLARKAYCQISPLAKLPLLRFADGRLLPESSIIIEFLDQHFHSGTQLLPQDNEANLSVRLLDRLIDNDLNNTLHRLALLTSKAEDQQDHIHQKQLENIITVTLSLLDAQLANHHWLCGDTFTLADCALLPCLDYALERVSSFELANLHRYHQQAQIRGAWMLVADEIALAQSETQAGKRFIP